MNKARHLLDTRSVFWLLSGEHYKMGGDNQLGHTEDNSQCHTVVFKFRSVCRMNYLEGIVQMRYLMKLDFRNIYSAMMQK